MPQDPDQTTQTIACPEPPRQAAHTRPAPSPAITGAKRSQVGQKPSGGPPQADQPSAWPSRPAPQAPPDRKRQRRTNPPNPRNLRHFAESADQITEQTRRRARRQVFSYRSSVAPKPPTNRRPRRNRPDSPARKTKQSHRHPSRQICAAGNPSSLRPCPLFALSLSSFLPNEPNARQPNET
jgi:hypothetical protein